LKPDLQTLRNAPWLKNEAFLIADLISPDDGNNIEYCPRNILKQVQSNDFKSGKLQSFTF
jgi:glutamine synthetase